MPQGRPAGCLTVPHDNATVVPPPARQRAGRLLPMAVLDRHGALIAEAACASHRRSSVGYVPPATAPAAALAGTWLFGGLASHHFGHQITRSLGRLAGLAEAGAIDGIVFVPLDRRTETAASRTLFRRLLDGLGIPHAIRLVTAPTRVERLLIGPDQFSEGTACTATPGYVDWARRTFLPDDVRPRPGSRLYVTRSRLDPTLGRVLCEDVLEENLARHGYQVFAPEVHGIPDQLRRYAAAETIVTTDGSHGHLIAFARQPGQRVVMIARRTEPPALLLNHLESFGHGLDGSDFRHLRAVRDEWWPSARADNRSFGELDFGRLRRQLVDCGALDGDASLPWTEPDAARIAADKARGARRGERIISTGERATFLAEYRKRRRVSPADTQISPAADTVPAIDGLRYFRMLSRLHAQLKPNWYLEVGTFTGKSLALASCNYVAVDPSFAIEHPVVNAGGEEMYLIQKTSDDFFASDFLRRNRIAFDLAFLDGMHHFEFLLRDFMHAEKAMAPGGVILLHDCCPTSVRMAARERPKGLWTGDVWKTLLILLRHRPDLDIQVASAAPTGIVAIRNLDRKSRKLERAYARIVADFADMTLDDIEGGLAGLYRQFALKSPEEVIASLVAGRT